MSEWSIAKLSDVVELRRGFDLPIGQRVPGYVPVLSAGTTSGWHDEARVEGPGFVVGRATNLGIPTWNEGPFWPLNTTLYAADFKGNDPRFLYRLFQSLDFTGFDSGSGNFVIDVLDESNQSTGDLLVNEIGSYEGATAFGINAFSEASTLQVTFRTGIGPSISLPSLPHLSSSRQAQGTTRSSMQAQLLN